MKTRIVWGLVSCLLVAMMVLASCATTTPQTTGPTSVPGQITPNTTPVTTQKQAAASTSTPATTPAQNLVTINLKRLDGTPVVKQVEKPQYGGTITDIQDSAIGGFDEATAPTTSTCYTNNLVYDKLLVGDWTRGDSGTGEVSFGGVVFPGMQFVAGQLAESWELVDNQTFVFHIRKGVLWQNKPPVNGREATADDVVFTIKRMTVTPTAETRPSFLNIQSITATDRYTVTLKCKNMTDLGGVIPDVACRVHITPHEVVDTYGNLNDWKNSIGTGPFTLTDYVDRSSATFKRNPNYWMKDPWFPNNQLPYVDTVRWLMIQDISTQLAALRTGKVEKLYKVSLDDGDSIKKTSPDLQFTKLLAGNTYVVCYQSNVKPWDDIRVRQALNMAIDWNSIVNNMYQGDAELTVFPYAPISPEQIAIGMWTPLSKLSAEVQDIYGYHPDKAKQLLAAAGYPTINTTLNCTAIEVDILSVMVGYWAKVGINVTLNVMDDTVWKSTYAAKKFTGLQTIRSSNSTYFDPAPFRPNNAYNASNISDPVVLDTFAKCKEALFDPAKQQKLLQDQIPYILKQSFMVQEPTAYQDTFWWPWLHNFHGEYGFTPSGAMAWVNYAWVDQALKMKMIGK